MPTGALHHLVLHNAQQIVALPLRRFDEVGAHIAQQRGVLRRAKPAWAPAAESHQVMETMRPGSSSDSKANDMRKAGSASVRSTIFWLYRIASRLAVFSAATVKIVLCNEVALLRVKRSGDVRTQCGVPDPGWRGDQQVAQLADQGAIVGIGEHRLGIRRPIPHR